MVSNIQIIKKYIVLTLDLKEAKMIKYFLFIVLLTVSWRISAQEGSTNLLKQTEPFILGQIDKIKSKALGEERTLNIYLPSGYNEKDTVRYPVIYLLDGSADEDFIHIVGLVQFESFEWVNHLPKSIVVGIANVDRKRDFTFPSSVQSERTAYPTTGHSARFIDFIADELQPFIAEHYKCNRQRTIIGESLGGLLATEILLKKPNLFDKYIIVSPSLWWDNGSLLKSDVKQFSEKQIYIGVGKEGLTPSESPHVMEVDANLLADKINGKKFNDVTVFFDYLPDKDHGTIMHQAVMNAFRLMH
jgi:predicted alpha/beta superfamily hydrolase